MENLSYDDLTEYATEVITEIRRRAYREGYGQGKYSQRLDSAINEVANITNDIGINIGETEQEKRDRIVEWAKDDIERFKVRGINGYEVYEVPRSSYISEALSRGGDSATCYARFVVNKEKRTVVALMRGEVSDTIYSRGIAKCAPGDCFNVHIGKAIALRRALGLEVPDGYLNAPQPTEVRKGDVIKLKYAGFDEDEDDDSMYYTRIVKEFDGECVRYEGRGWDFIETVDEKAEILDDSRDE